MPFFSKNLLKLWHFNKTYVQQKQSNSKEKTKRAVKAMVLILA